jgi:hypothetical protein
MLTLAKTALLVVALFPLTAFIQDGAAPGGTPEYTGDGQLKLPENYRQWVYLSSGFDMSYSPEAAMAGHHMFDNVFVNPESYKAFMKTGNQKGNYQGNVMGLEVHVKGKGRFPGNWAFFGFDDNKTSKMTPTSAACYSCHSEHGAVDTTFVQFYPTLLPIAKSKNTLSAAYVKEVSTSARK